LNKVAPASIALFTAVVMACGGSDASEADRAVVDSLTAQLVQENAQAYAFGCVDFDGTVLSAEYSPDVIAADVASAHVAESWSSETGGVVLGGEGQQYVVIQDTAAEPTGAQEFDEREVEIGEATLTCYVPK